MNRMTEVWYYKGIHKVNVVTKSEGYWIIEALEAFEDDVQGKRVKVKVGEQRIVPVDTLHKRKYLAPPIKEHAYELKMEKKVKRLIAEEEKKQSENE
jgi:Leu/Phe-tRNA-protein transferase